MLKIVWAELGRLPRALRAAAYQTGHDVVNVLEFPGPYLRKQDSQVLKHWIRISDVAVVCNTPIEGTTQDFGSIRRFVDANGKILIRIENTITTREQIHVVDRPGYFSAEKHYPHDLPIEDRLLFIMDSYAAANEGIVLPSDKKLILFESRAPITPLDIVSLIENPGELQTISPRRFEELVADLLTADGWNVELVSRVNASGPDIVALSEKTSGRVPLKMIVECKRHSGTNAVDINVVRKVMYWVNEEYRSTLGLIATTSRFTTAAKAEVEKRHRWRLDLRDQKDMVTWMSNAFLTYHVT